MEAVILAGGKGTRLGLNGIPKAMVSVNNLPLIHYQILQLQKYDVEKVYILLGFLGQIIKEYLSSIRFDLEIEYIVEKTPLGTAGALKQLENKLKDKFLVLYGDTYFDLNIKKFIEFYNSTNPELGTIYVHPNDHPYDSDLIEYNSENLVVGINPKPHKTLSRNIVNAAFYIFRGSLFKYIPKGTTDIARDIFPTLPTCSLAAYNCSEYIKDLGTPDRLIQVEHDISKGLPSKKNLYFPQKAIFLDRDGVVNFEKTPFISEDNFEIYEDVGEFIAITKNKGFLVFIVTNQPSIAKGFITIKNLNTIHSLLDKHLLLSKTFIDEIKFCPHHPEKGFEGEIEELKIKCSCRKPEIGMILDLVERFNIDVSKSYLIGDRYTDIKAGNDAGCKTVLIKRGLLGNDRDTYTNVLPNIIVENLNELLQIL